jgi:hypothetical protein
MGQQGGSFVTKRRRILITLLLLGCAAFLGYELAGQWKEYRLTHNIALLKAGSDVDAPTAKAGGGPATVPNYSAIVDHDLFSADRTSVVPPEAPPEPAKEEAPKPILVGTMQFDEDEFALMVSDTPRDNDNYKRLKVGDVLNGYTLVKILDQKVMMKADGKDVEVRLSVNEPSKMVARETQPASPTAVSGVGQVTSISSGGPVTSGATTGTVANQPLPKGTIPVGTILNGRRKKLVPSPFGMMETWEEVK